MLSFSFPGAFVCPPNASSFGTCFARVRPGCLFPRARRMGKDTVSDLLRTSMWVWVKKRPPGIGPQILLDVSIYQGKPFWAPMFDPQPCCPVQRCPLLGFVNPQPQWRPSFHIFFVWKGSPSKVSRPKRSPFLPHGNPPGI